MMFSNHFTTVALLLLSSHFGQQTVHQVQAQQNWNGRETPVTCSICRDANRPILNPTKSFTMTNGNTWTCDYLQETVQDVDANAEFESERLMCVQAQLQGENGGCECGGGAAALPDMQSEVSQELNPTCDLCANQQSSVVPTSNYDLAVTTDVVGAQNCQGLYDSLQEGIIDAELCAQVQQAAGATCCSSSSSGDSSSGFTTPLPITPTTSTTTNNDSSNNSNNISFNTGGDDSTSSVLPVTPSSPVVPETSAVPVVLPVTPSPIVPETPAAPVVPVTPAPIVLPVTVSNPSISTSTSTSTSTTSSVTTPINPQLPQYNTAGASGSGNERERIGEPTRDTNKDSRSGTIRGRATAPLANEPLP